MRLDTSRQCAVLTSLGSPQWLTVGDGQQVAFYEGGVSQGVPVLVVHGGPGGRSRPEPLAWWQGLSVRWACIDQRGCGASLPLGVTEANTVAALVGDMEAWRVHRGHARLALAAGSWGAVVALAYLRAYPQRVTGLLLRSPFLGSQAELAHYLAPWPAWLGVRGRAALGDAPSLPALYRARNAGSGAEGEAQAPQGEGRQSGQQGPQPDWLDDRLRHVASNFDAAQSAPGGVGLTQRFDAPPAEDALEAAVARAHWRVHVHYARQYWTLPQADAWPLARVALAQLQGPLSLVHGDADAICPAATSLALAALRADARIHLVAGGGHRMGAEPMAGALRAAAQDWVKALHEAAKLA